MPLDSLGAQKLHFLAASSACPVDVQNGGSSNLTCPLFTAKSTGRLVMVLSAFSLQQSAEFSLPLGLAYYSNEKRDLEG